MIKHHPAVLLITPFHKSQRGNTVTTRRICEGLLTHDIKAGLLSLEDEDFDGQLKDNLKSGRYNIVHAFNALYLAQLLASHPQLKEYPLIVTLTGTDLNQHGVEDMASLGTLFAAVRSIVVFHESFKVRLLSLYPGLEEKITVIPQGILLAPARPLQRQDYDIPADCTVFLLPTGLRPVKNVDLALDGLQLLAQQGSHIRLLLIGPIIEQTYGKRILERLESLPWAMYLGEVPHDQISAVFALGDVVINCSQAEGQPQAALEAMSMGIPVILSAVPGNLGIIEDGREGFYIGNPDELCQAASTLHCDTDLRQSMSQAAADLVRERFDYQREIRRHIDLYQRMLRTAEG
jgi:glycosyltransferase involved in cell wall biosynthesis